MTTFYVPIDGNWSGGGKAVLDNFRHAAARHSEIRFDSGDLRIVNRNFPRGGGSGPFILVPQNAWAWAGPKSGIQEHLKMLAMRGLSEMSMRRAVGVIRVGRSIPVRGKCWPGLLPNPLDTGFDQADTKSRSLPRPVTAPYIASVGSLHSYRGVETLMAAYALYRKVGGKLELHVVGGGHAPYVARLQRMSRELEGFHLHPASVARAEALAWLRHAQCVVLPSHVEASPMSVLEALAVQPRVIASDIPGHPDIVPSGVPGPVYFEQRDEAGLAQLLLESTETLAADGPLANPQYREEQRCRWGDTLIHALTFLSRAEG